MPMAHASAFLAELIGIYATEGGTEVSRRIEDLLARLLDRRTVRGEALLYNICHQPGLSESARERVVDYLDEAGFGGRITAWRSLLRLNDFLNPGGKLLDPHSQHVLLDTVLPSR